MAMLQICLLAKTCTVSFITSISSCIADIIKVQKASIIRLFMPAVHNEFILLKLTVAAVRLLLVIVLK